MSIILLNGASLLLNFMAKTRQVGNFVGTFLLNSGPFTYIGSHIQVPFNYAVFGILLQKTIFKTLFPDQGDREYPQK